MDLLPHQPQAEKVNGFSKSMAEKVNDRSIGIGIRRSENRL
jgi:hypothetical protein